MSSFLYEVTSLKGTHFTTEIIQDAADNESIVLPGALAGVNGDARNILTSILIISDQNLAWEIALFAKDTFVGGTDLDADTILWHKAFLTTDATRIAGAGSYYYFADGLNLPVIDKDYTGEVHISLINRSAAAKNAGATGEVVVKLWMASPDILG